MAENTANDSVIHYICKLSFVQKKRNKFPVCLQQNNNEKKKKKDRQKGIYTNLGQGIQRNLLLIIKKRLKEINKKKLVTVKDII